MERHRYTQQHVLFSAVIDDEKPISTAYMRKKTYTLTSLLAAATNKQTQSRCGCTSLSHAEEALLTLHTFTQITKKKNSSVSQSVSEFDISNIFSLEYLENSKHKLLTFSFVSECTSTCWLNL